MSRPPRIQRFTYVGLYRYFLTFCTFGRVEVFRDPDIVARRLMEFRRTAQSERFAILAYCVMPDHAHFLVEGTSDSANLKAFAKIAKQRSGGIFSRRHHRPLWQEGYYDRVLRADENVRAVVRYILNNPVRKGLVVNPLEYPYLGSDPWSLNDLLDAGSKKQDPAYEERQPRT